tara:strand:- start:1063 stop:1704 length:642 start_codon:yes stop_codon:yes gene_type:complete
MIIVQYSLVVKVVPDTMSEMQFNALNYDDPMVVRILDAGELCILRFGIRRTSMGEVARVGKLSRGSIYRYFNAKEALVEGIIRRQQERFLNHTEEQLGKETSLVDKVTHAVMAGRKDMQTGIFASLADVEPETLAMMFLDPNFYQRSLSFWPPHVRMAQEAGEIGAQVRVDFMTDLIVRMAVSLVMFPKMGVELKSRSAVRAYLQQVLCVGVC